MPVTVVLLAAGYGTRLYPLTKDRPKALLPLGDGVILDAIMASVAEMPEATRRLLVTNHRFAGQFEAWRAARGVDVQIVDDGTSTNETRLGAIRDLELARARGGVREDLLVIGTDNLFEWPLRAFAQAAQAHRPHPSVALWEAPSPQAATQFGVVTRDATDRITAFIEKSPQPPSTSVALCVYYFPAAMHPRIEEFLGSGEQTDAPGYFIAWLARRGPAFGIMMPGAWHDIGSRDAYDEVVNVWSRRATPHTGRWS